MNSKELTALKTQLQTINKAIKAIRPVRRTMAEGFAPEIDIVQAVKDAQKIACDNARAAKQICDDLTDILVQLEPP